MPQFCLKVKHMQSFEIHWNDWSRILFGNVPPEFFIEVIIRVTFVYLLIISCIRLMGKRMASQLSRNELVAISSLAASIGIPIQTPERGLLPAVLVAVIVVLGQRFVSSKAAQNQQFERISQGNIATLVKNGCLCLKEMEHSRISRAELFSELRGKNVMNLGAVKRFYFEAGGKFTLITEDAERAGLCILPAEDMDFIKEQSYENNVLVCEHCGMVKQTTEVCPVCEHRKFVRGLKPTS
jgi:uncharacterized membrane protein YcaP (DUF421 family)